MKTLFLPLMLLTGCIATDNTWTSETRCTTDNKVERRAGWGKKIGPWEITDDCNLYDKPHRCYVYNPRNPYARVAGCRNRVWDE